MTAEAVAMLQERLARLGEAVEFEVAWSVLELEGRRRWHHHGGRVVPSASTRKIAILMACLRAVHAGRLSLDDRLVVEAAHQDNDSGVVRHLRPGLVLTLYDALVLMIIVSDNAATSLIIEKVGLDAVNRLCHDLGMVGTAHVAAAPASSFLTAPTPRDLSGINTTTAHDMVLLLETIVAGAQGSDKAARLNVDTKLCRLAVDILTRQQYRDCLPRLLPTGTVVAHKTGVGPSNESDAGIVFRNDNPLYMIAVYVFDIPEVSRQGRSGRSVARDFIAGLDLVFWDFLNDPA